jgi:hypothetical protein
LHRTTIAITKGGAHLESAAAGVALDRRGRVLRVVVHLARELLLGVGLPDLPPIWAVAPL